MRIAFGQIALILAWSVGGAVLSFALTFAVVLTGFACGFLDLPWYLAGVMSCFYLLTNYFAHGRLKESTSEPEWLLSAFIGVVGAPIVYYACLPWSFFIISGCIN